MNLGWLMSITGTTAIAWLSFRSWRANNPGTKHTLTEGQVAINIAHKLSVAVRDHTYTESQVAMWMQHPPIKGAKPLWRQGEEEKFQEVVRCAVKHMKHNGWSSIRATRFKARMLTASLAEIRRLNH
ncbi:MAG: hypothetical protein AAB473_00640 [Patescibacteria group bacterium]